MSRYLAVLTLTGSIFGSLAAGAVAHAGAADSDLRRDGRLVEPTAEALQLLPRIRDGLSTLQQAIDETRIARGSGTLYISTLPSFLLQWLSPRLPDFLAQHPEINLRVEASSIAVDFNTTGIAA